VAEGPAFEVAKTDRVLLPAGVGSWDLSNDQFSSIVAVSVLHSWAYLGRGLRVD